MVQFFKEQFSDIAPELPELFLQHHALVVKDRDYKQLDIDWTRYLQLEATGMLHILTVRDEGKLVGYFFNVLMTHILYKNILHGFSDIFFVLPEYRKGLLGARFIRENEKMLKHLGVQKIYVNINEGYRLVGKLLLWLNYRPIERIFTKWVG